MLPLFGGLRPIRARIYLDAGAVTILLRNGLVPASNVWNWLQLLLIVGSTVVTAGGVTPRWTLTLPMVFYLLINVTRTACEVTLKKYDGDDDFEWGDAVYTMASVLSYFQVFCAVTAGLLSFLLFPAVELPPVEGPYNVGVVDLFLPVESRSTADTDDDDNDDFVSVKLFYPIDADKTSVPTTPYLDEADGVRVCDEMMRIGTPPPLDRQGWLFHYLTMVRLHGVQRHAPVASDPPKFRTAVYSHGLLGYAGCYTQQGLNLASHGTVVLMPNHADGSSTLTKRKDGNTLYYDGSMMKLVGKDDTQYVRIRRAQNEVRIREFTAAAEALQQLNTTNIPALESLGISFVDRLDFSSKGHSMTFAGHSFGAATALGAAFRRPDLGGRTVVLHDPATDWLPDDVRRTLFHGRFGSSNSESEQQDDNEALVYSGGTGGYETEERDDADVTTAVGEEKKKDAPDDDKKDDGAARIGCLDMLVLFSGEFLEKGWGECKLYKAMHSEGILGRAGGLSDYGCIGDGSRHQEFSDLCALTPLWLAHLLTFTGTKKHPIDTLEESLERTVDFINRVQASKKGAKKVFSGNNRQIECVMM